MPQPREEAVAVIENYLVGDDGTFEVPINAIALAERMGIRVMYSDTLGEGVSGVIVKSESDTSPRIFLNKSDAPVRQQFTVAHEIGHYRHRLSKEDYEFGFVDERSTLAASGSDPDERWANRFAAELLMPAFAVRKFFADGWDAQRLAREFGVSMQAMNFRLKNLYLV